MNNKIQTMHTAQTVMKISLWIPNGNCVKMLCFIVATKTLKPSQRIKHFGKIQIFRKNIK